VQLVRLLDGLAARQGLDVGSLMIAFKVGAVWYTVYTFSYMYQDLHLLHRVVTMMACDRDILMICTGQVYAYKLTEQRDSAAFTALAGPTAQGPTQRQ
jgi:hypothetical protein